MEKKIDPKQMMSNFKMIILKHDAEKRELKKQVSLWRTKYRVLARKHKYCGCGRDVK